MQKLIVVPARGGSKGIPGKNIYLVNGKPLLEYTLDMLEKVALEDTDIVVSTDSTEIKNIAERYKKVIVVDRPAEISGDEASTESALIHALNQQESKLNKKYQAVLTMQATSPLRCPETLKQFVEAYERSYPAYDAQLSLSEDRSDFWVSTDGNSFERLYKDAPRRRQERKPLYVENSAYYITDADALRKTNSVLGTCANGFLISAIEAVDINEPIDIIIVESLLKERSQT